MQGSGAEFSVAQGIYVETGSGWFSDRTTRYLASGKPALVQDTGFSRHLPDRRGAARRSARSTRPSREPSGSRPTTRPTAAAARALAEEYFDSDRVLGRLLEEVGSWLGGRHILVSGMIAGDPPRAARPGPCSSTCSGCERLGHEVLFVGAGRPALAAEVDGVSSTRSSPRSVSSDAPRCSTPAGETGLQRVDGARAPTS